MGTGRTLKSLDAWELDKLVEAGLLKVDLNLLRNDGQNSGLTEEQETALKAGEERTKKGDWR